MVIGSQLLTRRMVASGSVIACGRRRQRPPSWRPMPIELLVLRAE
jgi:hypothetical protein